jgi:hypothetical protein
MTECFVAVAVRGRGVVETRTAQGCSEDVSRSAGGEQAQAHFWDDTFFVAPSAKREKRFYYKNFPKPASFLRVNKAGTRSVEE